METCDEFTMTNETACFLRNELQEMVKHVAISEDTGISLINLIAALDNADRVIITIVPEY